MQQKETDRGLQEDCGGRYPHTNSRCILQSVEHHSFVRMSSSAVDMVSGYTGEPNFNDHRGVTFTLTDYGYNSDDVPVFSFKSDTWGLWLSMERDGNWGSRSYEMQFTLKDGEEEKFAFWHAGVPVGRDAYYIKNERWNKYVSARGPNDGDECTGHGGQGDYEKFWIWCE